VVSTLLTYLELEGVIAATGPFYAEYKFKSERPIGEILERFDPARRAFLSAVFAQAKRSRIWSSLDIPAVAQQLGEPRSRIVAALGFLEEQGALTVQATGARLGYRRVQAMVDVEALVENLFARFLDRERRDVSRVHTMLAFAGETGCLTARLTRHFGEILDEPCGHCGPCLGLAHPPLPEPVRPSFSPEHRAIVKDLLKENHRSLATRRQLARFLCGLASPSTTRSRLTRDPRFGALADFSFSRVLKLAEAAKS
jgi:ATP-dependent DNA helicase RecQ